MTDPYATLGVERDATEAQIKKAMRKLRREHHPDHHGGDDSMIKAINQAADILLDPVKRALFDKHGVAAEDPVENTARMILHALFGQALDGGAIEIVSVVRKGLEQSSKSLETELPQAQQALRGIEAKRKHYVYKGMDPEGDVLGKILAERVSGKEKQIQNLQRGIECNARALEILDRCYEDRAPKRIEHPGYRHAPRDFGVIHIDPFNI